MTTVRTRVLTTLAAVLLAACSASGTPSANPGASSIGPATPTSTPSLSPAPSAVRSPRTDYVGEADGVTLTVSLDHSVVAPGEVVTFTATLKNEGSEPVDYSVPRCGGGASLVLSVDLPQEPYGRTWSGLAQTFKDYVLTEGLGPRDAPPTQPIRVEAVAEPCAEGQPEFEEILAPGESVTSSLPWKAEIIAGVGALAGGVPFTVSAGYDRQNDPPSHQPGEIRGMWVPIYKQLVINGALEVVGEGRALAGPGEVIDAMLADKKYAKWLGDQPPETWTNPTVNLFLAPGRTDGYPPTGPSWDLDVFVENGIEPRHFALAFIDPFDASILLVQYCDVPCVE
jgi:hypothetical protein